MNKLHNIVLERNTVTEVPLDLIVFDHSQPRTEFDETRLASLADDVRAHGIEQPIELAVDGEQFTIVTGERRFRAAVLAELATVPARLARLHGTALAKLLRQAAENTLREDLSIVDKARLLRRLRDEHQVRVEELPELCKAHAIGDWSRSYISNLIRMTELPEWVLAEITANRIPASAAKHVAQIADLPRAMEQFKENIERELKGSPDAERHLRESDVSEMIGYVANRLYPRADQGYVKDAPYYDVAKHKDAVGLRKIDGVEYITDQLAHDALQAQHAKPHPKSPAAQYPHVHGKADAKAGAEKPSSEPAGESDEKEEAKKPRDKLLEVVNPQKVETYLIDWWRHYISMHGRVPAVINAVISWSAAGAPMNKSAVFGHSHSDVGMAVGLQKACDELKRKRLGDFLAHDLDDDDRLALFDRMLETMDKMPVVDIVGSQGWDFEAVYQIDSAFLALNTKATLDKLVRSTAIKGKGRTPEDLLARQSWNDCTKLEAMRGWCLARAESIGVPKELVKVWRDLQARAK